MKYLVGLFLGCLLTIAHTASAQPAVSGERALERAIANVLDSADFENAFWGLRVVDLETGETLYARNDEKSFVPASNVKLYTTAAALDQLGPRYRYRTRVYIDGPIENGVLRGNVIVRGSADPTIGTHYEPVEGKWEDEADATHLFREWADSLRAAGVTRVDGDVVGDDDVIDDVPLGSNWAWDDETYYYSAQLSGLPFNDNVIHMYVTARELGAPASIRWYPYNTDYVQVRNKSVSIHPDSSLDEGYQRLRGTNTIDVTTRVPVGDEDIEEITVENPTKFFAHVLRETFQHEGIAVSGTAVDVDELSIKPQYRDPAYRRIAYHLSPPLADIVSIINKPSQNLFADLVLKTLAAEFPRETDEFEPGSSEMGIEVAMRTYASAGIDTSRLQLVDGSGLSRLNLVTPEMTTQLLEYMWKHESPGVTDAFYSSLPVAGAHGTLRNRFERSPAGGNLRAKTGSLTAVSSLSGYITSGDDRPLAFSMMSNHYTTRTREIRRAQDAIVEILARYRR